MHVVQTASDTGCKTDNEGLKEQSHRMRAWCMVHVELVQAAFQQEKKRQCLGIKEKPKDEIHWVSCSESEAIQVCMQ